MAPIFHQAEHAPLVLAQSHFKDSYLLLRNLNIVSQKKMRLSSSSDGISVCLPVQ